MEKKSVKRIIGAALAALVLAVLAMPASAGTTQVSGSSVYNTECQVPAGSPPNNTGDYPPLDLSGSLDGCWYTNILTSRQISSGVYLETGQELFVGSLNGGAAGTFGTTYRFESKWDPDAATGTEIRGRCQHPIVAGSGTGGFAGATGRVDFKDIIGDPVTYVYRGHISVS